MLEQGTKSSYSIESHESTSHNTSKISKGNQFGCEFKSKIEDHDDFLSKKSNTILYRALSNPLVYDNSIKSTSTESDTEQLIDESSNSVKNYNNKAKSISSDPNLSLSNGQWKTAPLFDSSQTVDLHTAVQKRYSALCIPVNMTNKMSIQKGHQMSIGSGKVNKHYLQKINVNGKQIRVGLGFPTKAPVINKNSKMIETSERTFNNLEDMIQRIKDENNILLNESFSNDEEKKTSNNDEEYDDISKNNNFSNNIEITGQDISRLTDEISSTKKHFIEMETSILSDFNSIKTSINQIIEDRKEIQKQHKIWLENMKKKIYHTKEETKKIGKIPYDSI